MTTETKINILRKPTDVNKLTISHDWRVDLKVSETLSAEAEAWLVLFAQKIVEDVVRERPSPLTLRGRFYRHKNGGITLPLSTSGYRNYEKCYNSQLMGLSEPPPEL